MSSISKELFFNMIRFSTAFACALLLAIMASRLDLWPVAKPALAASPEGQTASLPAPKPAQGSPENKSKPPVPISEAPVASVAPGQNDAGNLAVLNALRADLEVAKLRSAIAQEIAKSSMVSSGTTAAPAPVPASLPAPKPASNNPKLEKLREPREVAPVVVSVQGVDGTTSATLQTRDKLTTVKVGDNFGGGVVSSITRNGVVVKNGKSTLNFRFE